MNMMKNGTFASTFKKGLYAVSDRISLSGRLCYILSHGQLTGLSCYGGALQKLTAFQR